MILGDGNYRVPSNVLMNGKVPYRYDDSLPPDGIESVTSNVDARNAIHQRKNAGLEVALYKVKNIMLFIGDGYKKNNMVANLVGCHGEEGGLHPMVVPLLLWRWCRMPPKLKQDWRWRTLLPGGAGVFLASATVLSGWSPAPPPWSWTGGCLGWRISACPQAADPFACHVPKLTTLTCCC